ncbi:MAG: single-stranded-DNA-specific exonuclease RecJ, partial [Spirochaetia bacterium]|nr:single-stranded-DNA-specific exonuclease RecJ [Spirochaetia bacterium]
MKQNWKIRNPEESLVKELAARLSLDAKLVRLIVNRGYMTPEEINEFLNPHPSRMLNPFLLMGMRDAVTLARAALAEKKRIGVFADSDLDGLTSLTLLKYVLSKQSDIVPRFPVNAESYGLTTSVIDEFHAAGCALIITADSGTRDIREIAYARSLGIDVIVTDHHEPDELLPDAVIINPMQKECPYPYKHLSGVGVAFKFCLALLLSYLPSYDIIFLLLAETPSALAGVPVKNGLPLARKTFDSPARAAEYVSSIGAPVSIVCENASLKEKMSGGKVYTLSGLLPAGFHAAGKDIPLSGMSALLGLARSADKLDMFTAIFFEIQRISSPKILDFMSYALSLVSIGNIADIVPLRGENRVLTACGLTELGKTTHSGLAKILGPGRVDSKKIGWELAPLLNSPGRFGNAGLTADFFISGSVDVLDRIHKINEERKEIINESVENAELRYFGNKFVTASYEGIPEGMAGLIANRLLDSAQKPVIVLVSQPEEGIVKGSGRAGAGFEFLSVVKPMTELFERMGGHQQAFGFSIKQENVEVLLERVSKAMDLLDTAEPVVNIDMEIQKEDITKNFLTLMRLAEPFGRENEEPLLLMKNVPLDSFSRFGKNNLHGKF